MLHFFFFKCKTKENLFLINKRWKAIQFIFINSFPLIFFCSNCLASDTHSTTKGLENSSSRKFLLEILDIFRLDAGRNSLHIQKRSGPNSQYLLISIPSSRIYCVCLYTSPHLYTFSHSLLVAVSNIQLAHFQRSNYHCCALILITKWNLMLKLKGEPYIYIDR